LLEPLGMYPSGVPALRGQKAREMAVVNHLTGCLCDMADAIHSAREGKHADSVSTDVARQE
jgi:hypothetical protein